MALETPGRAGLRAGEPLDKEVFDRFAARLSYLPGDFTDQATYRRVAAAVGDARAPVSYLEIPPFLFGTVIGHLASAGLVRNGRVVVEKPFGHDLASARAGPQRVPLDMELARSGGEGATPYEVLLQAAMQGNPTRFTRQDGVEETWPILQPLLDAPPVQPYASGSWGPAAADTLPAADSVWLESEEEVEQ